MAGWNSTVGYCYMAKVNIKNKDDCKYYIDNGNCALCCIARLKIQRKLFPLPILINVVHFS